MASLKALALMVIWSIVAAGMVNWLGLQEHYREFLGALSGGLAMLIILMVNVWIYFAVAKDEPWKWFKE